MSLANESVPTLFGVPLKLVSLCTLMIQNSSLILVMHYSRIMPGYDAESRYFASTAVLLNEVIKFFFCLFVSVRQIGLRNTYSEVFSSDSWKLAIPAFLYTIQNSLQYTAVSNLDAATFQVTYQLKILTTAFFSVTMLRRSLSRNQWISLVLLTTGIAMVQVTPEAFQDFITAASYYVSGKSATLDSEAKSPKGLHRLAIRAAEGEMNSQLGLVAVIIACLLSGLAGVYFEKVLKGSSASLWVRNVQLSFYSLFPAFFLGVWFKDGDRIAEYGFFHGYNGVVWTAILLQAFGGIIVALCVKFADNIAKNFATSISILVSFVASVYFFDFVVTVNFLLGASIVIFATYLYAKPDGSSGSADKPLLPRTISPDDTDKRE
ncbi:hypothetical protein D0Z00_001634 [Geotrichum galactomycetum]|uniref:Uncharacterized protein n=1 Tax=Geotrichum galactomycetum TaxID=27317 RepID=A0ACB6V6D4_9ASCO|nr:hypothetical protein D0Z00_001634 [Geotrichum candidum]